MAEVTDTAGLCSTCNYASSCVYRQGREGPVQYCEMFAEVVEKYDGTQGGLIATLEEIQSKYGYLPEAALRIVAEKSGRSLVDVYGVATFYRLFSLKPRGKHLLSVCKGTACHVRGGPKIAEEFENQLGIKAGETTADREFTLEAVNCLGACALGPVAVIDGRYFPSVTKTKVKEIIDKARTGLDTVEVKTDRRVFPVEVSCPRCNHSLMDSSHLIDGCPSISVTVSFEGNHGRLKLSSLYGSYSVESDFKLPHDTVINFFCPHCHAELLGGSNCAECGARMVPMIIRGGGIVQICSRRGCKGHLLDLAGTMID
ncbi:MAG: NAD(P)H-dependent oxidoreductase subunit E [candidate division Zixibacteria bacterium]|nr:NAD(P)H-dependent oxidoreductase subunit E [candidate division Zixibacteria bacterium]